jgi:hypothetical protein
MWTRPPEQFAGVESPNIRRPWCRSLACRSPGSPPRPPVSVTVWRTGSGTPPTTLCVNAGIPTDIRCGVGPRAAVAAGAGLDAGPRRAARGVLPPHHSRRGQVSGRQRDQVAGDSGQLPALTPRLRLLPPLARPRPGAGVPRPAAGRSAPAGGTGRGADGRGDRLRLPHRRFTQARPLAAANAALIGTQSLVELAQMWGGGLLASVADLRFVVPVKSINTDPRPSTTVTNGA